ETHPALHRARRKAEHLGDLPMSESAEIGELDHLPLLDWKHVQSGADVIRFGTPLHLGLRPLCRWQPRHCLIVCDVATGGGRLATERVDRAVVDDAEHPGTYAAAPAVIAGPGPPQRQERLLDDVLRHRPPSTHPVRERERCASVAV